MSSISFTGESFNAGARPIFSLRCRKVVALIVLSCYSSVSIALLPLLSVVFSAPVATAALWIARISATQFARAKALEWSLYVHGAVASILLWNAANDSGTPLTNQSQPVTIPAEIVLGLDPNGKRTNPDPNKFEFKNSTDRDVTPKDTVNASSPWVTSSGTTPTTYTAMNQQMTSGQVKQWTETNGLPRVVYKISNSNPAGTQSTYLNENFANTVQGSFTPGQIVYQKGTTLGSTAPFDHLYNAVVATSSTATRALQTGDLYKCPDGYTNNTTTGKCDLTDPSQVKKENTPCEFLIGNGGVFATDPANPNCNLAASKITNGPGTLRVTRATDDYDQVINNSDGTMTIEQKSPAGNRSTTLGRYDPSLDGGAGGRPITAQTNTPPGTGTGTTGNGSGSCGSTDQTACKIDDSGFDAEKQGVSDAAGRALTALDAQKEAFDNLQKPEQNLTHGVDATALFSLTIPSYNCAPIRFQFLNADVPVNLCDDGPIGNLLAMFRWAEGALLSWAGMWYLWRRFTDQYHTN